MHQNAKFFCVSNVKLKCCPDNPEACCDTVLYCKSLIFKIQGRAASDGKPAANENKKRCQLDFAMWNPYYKQHG